MSLQHLQTELLPKLNAATFSCYSAYTNLDVKEKYLFIKDLVKTGLDYNWNSFMDTFCIPCNEEELLLSCLPEEINPALYFEKRVPHKLNLGQFINVYDLAATIMDMENGEERLDDLILNDKISSPRIWKNTQEDHLKELASILYFMLISNAAYLKIEGSKDLKSDVK